MNMESLSIDDAAELVESGGVVVYPTDTVYGVGADALNPVAVERVYKIKERPTERPLSVAVATLDDIEEVAHVPDDARGFVEEFLPGGVTPLLPRKRELPDIVTSGDLVGVRIPDDKESREFLEETPPLTSTSANMSGEPAATHPDELGRLGDRVDGILDDGDRTGEPSTVVDTTTWGVVRKGAEYEEVSRWLSRNAP